MEQTIGFLAPYIQVGSLPKMSLHRKPALSFLRWAVGACFHFQEPYWLEQCQAGATRARLSKHLLACSQASLSPRNKNTLRPGQQSVHHLSSNSARWYAREDPYGSPCLDPQSSKKAMADDMRSSLVTCFGDDGSESRAVFSSVVRNSSEEVYNICVSITRSDAFPGGAPSAPSTRLWAVTGGKWGGLPRD